ncbi:MAG: hypothetical protein JO138_03435 [Acidobacteriaceae bacterium]|nr:hypothetical protein [Acidobacteriaceae bacterium]
MIGWSLAGLSVLFGFFTFWTFRRTVDLVAFRKTRKRLLAHLLEFRLFYDDPALIWRAQKAIVRENLHLLDLLARPALILTLPTVWLLMQLETVYAYSPLEVGKPAVINAQITGELTSADASAMLLVPPEISLETPAVRSVTDRQISWRIRPLRPVCGSLRLQIRGAEIGKTICAGTRRLFLVRRRVQSLIAFLLRPEEARLPRGDVAWLQVDYPETDLTMAGLALPWIAWFVLLWSASAVVFARWFRVAL